MSRDDEVLGYYCDVCSPKKVYEANEWELKYPGIESVKPIGDIL